MSILQAIFLGVIQGLTEFIPVSSSGHLLLTQHVLGVQKTGITFDVALHIGTLVALLLYFHQDIWKLFLGLLGKNNQKRLAWLLVFATLPAVIGGILLQSAAESTFRSPRLVSINLIIVAALMIFAERLSKSRKKRNDLESITNSQAAIMGFAQVLALAPGVSRSGSTITAGLFSGIDRIAATRFSFLLAIPITAGAILKVVLSGDGLHQFGQQTSLFVVGIITAFVTGLFAIRFMLSYLAKHDLSIFAYYRIALGLITLLLLAI